MTNTRPTPVFLLLLTLSFAPACSFIDPFGDDSNAKLSGTEDPTFPLHSLHVTLENELFDSAPSTIINATIDRDDIANILSTSDDTVVVRGLQPGTALLTVQDDQGATHTATITVEIPATHVVVSPVHNYDIPTDDLPALLILPDSPVTISMRHTDSKGNDVTERYTSPTHTGLQLSSSNPNTSPHTTLTREDNDRWTLHSGQPLESLTLLLPNDESLPVEVVSKEDIHSASLVVHPIINHRAAPTVHTSPPEHTATISTSAAFSTHLAVYDEHGIYIVGDAGQPALYSLNAPQETAEILLQPKDAGELAESEYEDDIIRALSHSRAAYIDYKAPGQVEVSVDWIIDLKATITVADKPTND